MVSFTTFQTVLVAIVLVAVVAAVFALWFKYREAKDKCVDPNGVNIYVARATNVAAPHGGIVFEAGGRQYELISGEVSEDTELWFVRNVFSGRIVAVVAQCNERRWMIPLQRLLPYEEKDR